MATSIGINTRQLLTVLILTLGLYAQGCSTTETQPACAWVYSPDECEEKDDKGDGHDEVGETGGEMDMGDPEPACITAPDGTHRTLHQCNGNLAGSISFVALNKSCAETLGGQAACEEIHSFGTEPYEMAKVIACCDPYGEGSDIDEYLTYCAVDMVQQICSSVSARIKNLIDDGKLPATAETTAIQKWIATNQNDCFQAFWGDNMATQAGEVIGSWTVPNKLAWQALVKDFTVTIDASAVTSVKLPEDPVDYVECTDIGINNTEIFESNVPPTPGITSTLTLVSEARAAVFGPMVMGGHISGAEYLASRASGCALPWCSQARISVAADRDDAWTLEDMNLFVDGSATLSNGNLSLDVDRASIRLYGTSQGFMITNLTGTRHYEIRSGAAHFVVAGASSQGVGLYMLTNSSPITARESGTIWSLDQFTLDFVDGNGATWVLTLPPTVWE